MPPGQDDRASHGGILANYPRFQLTEAQDNIAKLP